MRFQNLEFQEFVTKKLFLNIEILRYPYNLHAYYHCMSSSPTGHLFSIEVKNQILQIDNHSFPVDRNPVFYHIKNENGSIIRKGNFVGKCVQMRLNALSGGEYKIILYQNENHEWVFDFQL